jgi:hypothetical protein
VRLEGGRKGEREIEREREKKPAGVDLLQLPQHEREDAGGGAEHEDAEDLREREEEQSMKMQKI